MATRTDADLLIRTAQGDASAFNELVGRYREALVRHVRQRTGRADVAEDSVQEIFLSLWRNRHSVYADEQGSLAPYLYTAARYAIIDHFSQPNVVIPFGDMLGQLHDLATADRGDTRLLLHELHAMIRAEIDRMPPRLRSAFLLSREDNLTIREIAERLALSEQTVKNNISAALALLRRALHQYREGMTLFLLLVAGS